MNTNTSFNNPTPVAVSIIPIQTLKFYTVDAQLIQILVHDVLYVQRNIEPFIGKLALPGGFVNEMERIEFAAHRETLEETGINIPEDNFNLYRSEITPNNRNLIFCVSTPITTSHDELLQTLNLNLQNIPSISTEVQGFHIGNLNILNFAFPLHQKAISKYLDEANGRSLKNSFVYSHLSNTSDISLKIIQLLQKDGYLSDRYTHLSS